MKDSNGHPLRPGDVVRLSFSLDEFTLPIEQQLDGMCGRVFPADHPDAYAVQLEGSTGACRLVSACFLIYERAVSPTESWPPLDEDAEVNWRLWREQQARHRVPGKYDRWPYRLGPACTLKPREP